MAQGLQSRRTREEVLNVPDVHKAIVQAHLRARWEGAAKAMAHHFDLSVAAILAAGIAEANSEQPSQKTRRRRS